MLTIILVIVSLILSVLCFFLAKKHKLDNQTAWVIAIGCLCGISVIFSAILAVLWASSEPKSETVKSYIIKNSRVYLHTIDADTLNGREYYLVANPNDTYTYVTESENGDLQPQTIEKVEPSTLVNEPYGAGNKFFIREDEEEKPYLEQQGSITTTIEDRSWLLPFGWGSGKTVEYSKYGEFKTIITIFHVPVKSVKYYVEPIKTQEESSE